MQPWQYTATEWRTLPMGIRERIAAGSPIQDGSNLSHSNYHALQVYHAARHHYIDPEVLESLAPQLTHDLAVYIANFPDLHLPAMVTWAVGYLPPAAILEFVGRNKVQALGHTAITKYWEGWHLLVKPAAA
jgi:hypothetical protein